MFGNQIVNYGGPGGIRRGLIWQSGAGDKFFASGWADYFAESTTGGFVKSFPYGQFAGLSLNDGVNDYIWNNPNPPKGYKFINSGIVFNNYADFCGFPSTPADFEAFNPNNQPPLIWYRYDQWRPKSSYGIDFSTESNYGYSQILWGGSDWTNLFPFNRYGKLIDGPRKPVYSSEFSRIRAYNGDAFISKGGSRLTLKNIRKNPIRVRNFSPEGSSAANTSTTDVYMCYDAFYVGRTKTIDSVSYTPTFHFKFVPIPVSSVHIDTQ